MNGLIWLSPESFVDLDDLERHGRGAILLLKELLVKRDTEYDSLRRMFMRAMKKPMQLLPSQEVTLRLAEEARRKGVTETTYIAEQLGIHRQSAYERLRSLDQRLNIITLQRGAKTLTSGDSVPIYSEDGKYTLSRDEIKKAYAGIRVTCPTQAMNIECQGTIFARHGLCYSCRERYGMIQEERPDWVQGMVRMVWNEAYREAKQVAFDKKYRVNMDVSDIEVA